MQSEFGHTPVLVNEVVDLLAPTAESVLLDGTVGVGGHAAALLQRSGKRSTLVGLDRDVATLAVAKQQLAPFGRQVTLIHGSYADAPALLAQVQPAVQITHILLDLGFSSLDIEHSGRGFSFRADLEPLDMRFDPDTQRMTAAAFLRTADAEAIANVLHRYGEEPSARAIAQAIVKTRRDQPVETVADLVGIVQPIVGRRTHGKHLRIHPATQTFQALRIHVNDELGTLERALPQLVQLLAPHGRIAVISFHSLEDRIVKSFFKKESTDCICPPSFPECRCGHVASLSILTKHPITPTEEEQTTNPRSRSAKLRGAEKIQPS